MSLRYALILLIIFLPGCTEFNGAKAYLLPPSALGIVADKAGISIADGLVALNGDESRRNEEKPG